MTWHVNVEEQDDGYYSLGANPTTARTMEEVQEEFDDFMRNYFREYKFWCGISYVKDDNSSQGEFQLSAGSFNPYADTYDVLMAMTNYVYTHFSVNYGIKMEVYFG